MLFRSPLRALLRRLRGGAAKPDMDIFTSQPAPADARIPYGPDPLQFGDLRLPPGGEREGDKVPVVIVVHGGFWRNRYNLDHIGHACIALAQRGVATWSVEYRRIGDEGGAWPGTFLDVAAAADHLREIAPRYNLDLDRVVATGHSAGGHLALWLGARHRIPEGDPLYTSSPLPLRGVVSLAGVADLRRGWEMRLSQGVVRDFMGATPDEEPSRYATASPIEMVPLGIPQALVHGTADENVPYEIAERYHAAVIAAGDDIKMVTLPGTGHFEVIDPGSREWPLVVSTLLEMVGL